MTDPINFLAESTVRRYQAELNFLSYDTSSDMISIPIRIRERHLTKTTDSALVQCIGFQMNIMIWSDRDNIIFEIPLNDYHFSDVSKRKLSGPSNSLIAIEQFSDAIYREDDTVITIIRVHDNDK